MDDFLLTEQSSGGGFFDQFGIAFQEFLIRFGDSPVLAMGWLIAHGGWIVLIIVVFYMVKTWWYWKISNAAMAAKQWILLAVDVPRATEQTVRAVENMFAHIAGAHSPPTFQEKWIQGHAQDTISFEIISIEGHVQYLIRTTSKLRDLIEASLYAQYPDAEITEVEDYTLDAPTSYPNDSYDCFGTEWIPVKSDVYPLKSYLDFEHQLTGEFKDPLAVMLEGLSRLGPGEQAWYQMVIEPIDQKAFVEKAEREIIKRTGKKVPMKKGLGEKIFLDFPIQALSEIASVALGGSEEGEVKKKEENPLLSRMFSMTPGEKHVLEGIENKASHINYLAKMRFVYIAKKEIFRKAKIVQSLVGAIKQFNTNDMQSLKPEGKKVGMSAGLILFPNVRNNERKGKLIRAYRNRSMWAGMPKYHLSTEELASLWHLPVSLNVKAPQLKKTDAKKAEPPMNLPFA